MTKLQQLPKLIRLLLRLQDMAELPDVHLNPPGERCYVMSMDSVARIGILPFANWRVSQLTEASGKRTFCTTWSIN